MISGENNNQFRLQDHSDPSLLFFTFFLVPMTKNGQNELFSRFKNVLCLTFWKNSNIWLFLAILDVCKLIFKTYFENHSYFGEFPRSFPMRIFFQIKIIRRQVTINKNFLCLTDIKTFLGISSYIRTVFCGQLVKNKGSIFVESILVSSQAFVEKIRQP